MTRLFIDTWGWLTLHDKGEAQHTEARDFYRNFRRDGGSIFTSDYILDETITLLFRRLHFTKANNALDKIEQAVRAGYLRLERITEARFEKAKGLRRKFRDKPLISFTDLTSMVVMQDCSVTQILTEDEHFLHVGMGFQKAP